MIPHTRRTMITEERQTIIKAELLEKKSISVAELAQRYDVSFETIRRDIKELEKEGIAKKIYGGAVLAERAAGDFRFSDLANIMVDTKQKMAQTAAQAIRRSDCIYIDFSTTCGQMADIIGAMNSPVNVMTSSLDVMAKLEDKSHVSLISVGGEWDTENRAFMGTTSVQTLHMYHLDKAFISCRAISMAHGLSDKSGAESELRKAIIESANQVFLVVDHTKFDRMAFVKTAGFEKISAVITDEEPSAEWKHFFKERDIELCWTND